MKKKINKLINKSLRFHHRDIHEELAYIRGMLENVTYQMQELQQTIRESSNQDEKLSVRESYEHPWYKYKRQELIASGNYTKLPGNSTTNSK